MQHGGSSNGLFFNTSSSAGITSAAMVESRKENAAGNRRNSALCYAAMSAPKSKMHGRHDSALQHVEWVPLVLTTALFLISFTSRIQQSAVLARSFWAACAALLAWQGLLVLRSKTASSPALILTAPRAQHFIQAACQLSIYVYWGWHWRPVYDYAWLLLAQLLFAYALDMLLSWTRRGSYVFGFGPFPIIFSTNLFLWFKDDWFYLQFLLVTVGVLGKEFVRWNREGRYVHIFNPSAFTLGLFSVVLLVTGTTHVTWGPEIASTLTLAPQIYLYLFVVGLIVLYFFSVTLVTASAAAVLIGLSALYTSFTGVPYFLDSEIPSAVFLGLHFLVTDPSTSPRTPLGRLVFGLLYGCGVFGLYSLLGSLGQPTFYDNLMCVPLLNLSVPWIDRAVQLLRERPLLHRLGLDAPLGRLNVAHMAVWVAFFFAMTAIGKTDGRHTGDRLPFWSEACNAQRATACRRLIQVETTYCNDNSGWACNEAGLHYFAGKLVDADRELAQSYFAKACEARFQAACLNTLDPAREARAQPRALDLRLLLREGGHNLIDMPEPELYSRACEHGWTFACQKTLRATGSDH